MARHRVPGAFGGGARRRGDRLLRSGTRMRLGRTSRAVVAPFQLANGRVALASDGREGVGVLRGRSAASPRRRPRGSRSSASERRHEPRSLGAALAFLIVAMGATIARAQYWPCYSVTAVPNNNNCEPPRLRSQRRRYPVERRAAEPARALVRRADRLINTRSVHLSACLTAQPRRQRRRHRRRCRHHRRQPAHAPRPLVPAQQRRGPARRLAERLRLSRRGARSLVERSLLPIDRYVRLARLAGTT